MRPSGPRNGPPPQNARVLAQLQQALALHQGGELDEARVAYERVLAMQAGNADALHLLGVLWIQRENFPLAIDLISRAIRQQPGNAAFHYNRGSACHRSGDLEAAIRDYTRALELNPQATDAGYNRGNARFALGRWREAVGDYDQVLVVQPSYAEAWCNRGVALQRLGDFAAALASFDRAIQLRDDYAEAHCNRGTCLRELKRPAEALASFERALTIRPAYAEALSNRGIALQDLGRFEPAVQDFERALALRPNFAHARYGYANALSNLGRLEAARENYDRAISLQPDFVAAYTNRGNLWFACGRFDLALADFDWVLHRRPDDADALTNRGNTLVALGRIAEAIQSYDRLIEIRPGLAGPYQSRAGAWEKLREFDRAVSDYDRALALRPESHLAAWNKGLIHLARGEFARGWALYERRWHLKGGTPPAFPFPRWTGSEPFAGRKIFVYAEQGLGDTVQFCRYIPLVADRGAEVMLEVQPALVPLLQKLPGVSRLLARGEPRPACDFECPLLTLPSIFTSDLASIPVRSRYLSADSEYVGRWSARLGPRRRRRVGLVWRGNPRQANDRSRSMPLADLLSLLPPAEDYFSLQKDLTAAERALLTAQGVTCLDSELESFADTAAVCELLDLVISVCTSVAHLSAALGRPTWILLAYCADWRWFCDRSDSPWYPTVRLFRQAKAGDWASATAALRAELDR
jgi:tetratricopeptide (TPR) repeat protein